MDEIKQASEIDNALRELAKQRDELLIGMPRLSPERQAVLSDFLVQQFPVERALCEAATKRDELLNPNPPTIPASVESILQLMAAEPAPDEALRSRASDWRARAAVWLSRPGALLTACVIIACAILCFGRWGAPSRQYLESLPRVSQADRMNTESGVIWDQSPMERAELFTRKVAIGPFNLSTSERASLQASFLANSGIYLADGIDAPVTIRLDLPVRAIFMQDALARTP